MKILALLGLAMLTASPAAHASDGPFDNAVQLRLSGHTELALDALKDIQEQRPRDAHVKFEIGVALAEVGRCAAAARSFNAGKMLTKQASYKVAVDNAMGHLCPRLAPLETSITGAFVFDSNSNGGSNDRHVSINGRDFTLSGDAIAKSGTHFNGYGRVAYNFKISHRAYIVPEAFASFKLHEDEQHSRYTPGVSVAYRYKGDKHDVRFGPSYSQTFDNDGQVSENKGVFITGTYGLTETLTAQYRLDHTLKDLSGTSGKDKSTSFSLNMFKSIDGGRKTLSLGYVYAHTDAVNYMDDVDQHIITASLYGSITDKFGYELYMSQTFIRGDDTDPIFGVEREDDITRLGVNVSFPSATTLLGRPYAGLSYTKSKSSFSTKNYDNVSVNIGLTKSF